MLMAVVVVFFICQTPALAYHIIWATSSGRLVNNRTGCEAYCITREVSSLLVTLNSSVNVLLYYLFSDKFRCELRLICCHCVMRNSCPTTRLDSRATQKTTKYTPCQMQNAVSLKPNGSNTSGDKKIALGKAGQSNPRALVRQITTCSTVELTQEAAELCGLRGGEASAAV
ncbi:GPRNNA1 [Bugula neritina]|uniref:GPRNNA1 n=1 Tax=Bugula neritina TaxID=10212 RepID=A0A7J7KDD9_BUGNE|nr:GPRNNA1 [Bugula neritina]